MGEVRQFALPDLGEGLTEATIVRWLVAVGDTVRVDEPVVEVETAKALVEVPCPYAGVVTSHAAEEGAEVAVGAPLVTVAVGPENGAPGSGPDGDAAPRTEDATPDHTPGTAAEAVTGPAAGRTAPPDPEHVGGSGNVLVGYGTAPAPGRRRRVLPSSLAGPVSPSPARAAGAGPRADGTPHNGTDRSTRAHPDRRGASRANGDARTPVPVISPLVRRLARENSLDLSRVTGSGPDGLILRADVERALRTAVPEGAPADPHSPPPAPTGTAAREGTRSGADGVRGDARTVPGDADGVPGADDVRNAVGSVRHERRIPLRGVRGTAAARLSRSRSEIPDASCWVDADATELLAARARMNAAPGYGGQVPPVSLLALLARVCTAALARFPELNATVDTEAREIVVLPEVHLGFAAQTDRGLVVPVVRDAHTMTAEELTAETARLTEAARAGRLSPAELTGGTFTLNNYGVFGVDGSTPIINHPEAAMLGVGRIARKPWVVGDELAVRSVVQLSLTFDHRVCDGGTAGGFLRHVADCVEQPARLLRTL